MCVKYENRISTGVISVDSVVAGTCFDDHVARTRCPDSVITSAGIDAQVGIEDAVGIPVGVIGSQYTRLIHDSKGDIVVTSAALDFQYEVFTVGCAGSCQVGRADLQFQSIVAGTQIIAELGVNNVEVRDFTVVVCGVGLDVLQIQIFTGHTG